MLLSYKFFGCRYNQPPPARQVGPHLDLCLAADRLNLPQRDDSVLIQARLVWLVAENTNYQESIAT